MEPKVTPLARDATHRLIPAKYSDRDESVLTRLSDDRGELDTLFALEGASNDRLLAEAGLLPGITLRELVFGVPFAHIVNAAFTHPRLGGGRFNRSDRGAWYAGFSREISETEVAYHKAQELREIRWQEKESFTYVDFLADFRGEFHDLRGDPRSAKYLEPGSYKASQRCADDLLAEGSAGIVYPSVRHDGGTCIACFRPALVGNVRKGCSISITFENAGARPAFRKLP